VLRNILPICSIVLLAATTDASVVIEVVNPPPPPVVPNVLTHLQVINLNTGEVAYSRSVNGSVQSAVLSDINELLYSTAEPGTPAFSPQSALYVQPIGGAQVSPLLTHEGPIWNINVTPSRLMWQDGESIKVRSRADGSTQSYGDYASRDAHLSGNKLLYYKGSTYLNQYHVAYVDLETNDFEPYLFWNRGIHSLALAHHQEGGDGPIVLVHSPLGISDGRIYSDNEFFALSGGHPLALYKDDGFPFNVRSFKTNGGSLVFKDVVERQIDESHYSLDSSLYLSNSGNIVKLSGPQSDAYALGTYDVSWIEIDGTTKSLFVRNIASGQTRPLSVNATDYALWDMNSQYVLLTTTEPVPEPTAVAPLLAATFLSPAKRRYRR
jgi:hypothetical protein